MKIIENLLAEYKIRFRDTGKIKEEGYPFDGHFPRENGSTPAVTGRLMNF